MFPETGGKKILVVIPVYNEGPVIREVIQSLLSNKFISIIVVDDGSQRRVRNLIADLPVTLLTHRANLGQGAALQTGFEFAKQLSPDIVITFDADGQHDVKDIFPLVTAILKNETDIVFGSRFLGKRTNIPFTKVLLLKIATIINFFFSGLLLTDAHNGLRAFGKLALNKINLVENRMAHASEILFQVKIHKLRYMEVPVHIHYTDYAHKKGQSVIDSIKILFDLVLHKLFK